MHKISENTTPESVNNSVKLFTRDTSPYYYCQIIKPDTGKWVQKSTKTTDRDEALLFAQDWYVEMCFLHKRGYSSTPTQFSNVCDIYLQELDKEQALHERTDGDEGRSLKDLKSYRTIVEQFIKPYFGDKSVDVISNVDVQSFFDWRRTFWTEGPGKDVEFTEYERAGRIVHRPVKREEASDGTITRNGLVLSSIFNVAVRNRLIDEIKVPKTSLPTKNHRKAAMGKMQPKPEFTIDQYQKLLARLPEWYLDASRDKNLRQYTYRRLLLWDLIELIANTGSMTIHDIANQCGNSVGTIEKHYAKVDVKSTAHRQKRIGDI